MPLANYLHSRASRSQRVEQDATVEEEDTLPGVTWPG
jgi:hypothetical protein